MFRNLSKSRVGVRVVRSTFRRVDPDENLGTVVGVEVDEGVVALVVRWDAGYDQLVDPRDVRRFKLGHATR